jgi:hypothetical protein
MYFCKCKQVTVKDTYTTGQKVMGRANQRLGNLLPGSPEDLRFCGFFGMLAKVSVVAWDMMENHSVLPPTPKFLCFLWALAFMCTYPANNTTLSSFLPGRDQDNKQVCVAVHPVSFCIEQIFDKLIVVFDFIE